MLPERRPIRGARASQAASGGAHARRPKDSPRHRSTGRRRHQRSPRAAAVACATSRDCADRAASSDRPARRQSRGRARRLARAGSRFAPGRVRRRGQVLRPVNRRRGDHRSCRARVRFGAGRLAGRDRRHRAWGHRSTSGRSNRPQRLAHRPTRPPAFVLSIGRRGVSACSPACVRIVTTPLRHPDLDRARRGWSRCDEGRRDESSIGRSAVRWSRRDRASGVR